MAELISYGIIAAVTASGAAAFAYTAGWLSPARLAPTTIVHAFTPPGVAVLGHRRNHAKGVCFTGVFEANGTGAAVSRAPMLAAGRHRVVGRLNLGTGDPNAPDATARVRGMGLEISAGGEVWRTAMIDAPVFAVATVDAFYALQLASASAEPGAMQAFAAAHPEFVPFGTWAQTAPWTGSYAEDHFYGLNAFIYTDAAGTRKAVRWSLLPAAQPVAIPPEELARRGPDALEQEITSRVAGAPVRWTLAITIANPGDPTSDSTNAWPQDRRTIKVGTLVVERIEAEPDGPCRDIVFDPTILPNGMETSDDPIPAARSSTYAKSYDLRSAEAGLYPRTRTGAKP